MRAEEGASIVKTTGFAPFSLPGPQQYRALTVPELTHQTHQMLDAESQPQQQQHYVVQEPQPQQRQYVMQELQPQQQYVVQKPQSQQRQYVRQEPQPQWRQQYVVQEPLPQQRQYVVQEPLSLACDAGPSRRVGRGHLQCCLKASSISRPYVSFVRGGAVPSRRMGLPTALHSSGPSRPVVPASLTSLTVTRRHAIAPDVVTYRAALSVRKNSPQHPPALHLLRAMLGHAIVPDVVPHRAAIRVSESASSARKPYISYDEAAPCHRAGCGHLQCCPQCVRKAPAEPADLTSLTRDAAPCHRAGCGPAAPAALHLLRAMRSHAIARDVSAYSVVVSGCERASRTSRPYSSCPRCSAMPSRRTGSPTALP